MSKKSKPSSREPLARHIANNIHLLETAFRDSHVIESVIDINTISISHLIQFCNTLLEYKKNDLEISRWACDLDLIRFILSTFTDICNANPTEQNDYSEPCTLDHDTRKLFINKLTEGIFSAPYNYIASIPLPNFPFTPEKDIELSSCISIHRTNKNAQPPNQTGLLGTLLSNALITQDRGHVQTSLRINCLGFIGTSSNSPVSIQALNKFKHVVMLSIFLGLLEIKEQNIGPAFGLQEPVYEFSLNGFMSNDAKCRLPFLYTHALASLFLTRKGEETYKKLGSLDTEDQFHEFYTIKFCLDSTDESCMRIKASLEWLFESYFMQNTTTSLVMTCLAIESLIGDDDSKNKKEVLASRLSFSIGKTYNHRKQLHDEFVAFYNKRSRIVHGSETMLNTTELRLLQKMQFSIRWIINTELGNLLPRNTQ